jgi:hypothetical protein
MTVLTRIVATLHMLPTIANDVADIMFRNKNDRKLIPRPAIRGVHSSTCELNVSAFGGTRGM